MNGDTAMPAITFGEDCTYDMLDVLLNANDKYSYAGWGLAVKLWLKQGVAITALWGCTKGDVTTVLAWSSKAQDYCNEVDLPTDDIVKVEVL